MSSTDISRMDVPATVQPEGQAIALPSDVSQAITQMAQIMQGMEAVRLLLLQHQRHDRRR